MSTSTNKRDFDINRIPVWLRFAGTGVTGTGVDLLVLSVLTLTLPFAFARCIAIGVAMTWNFVINRCFTFPEGRRHSLLSQYVLFVLSCSVGGLINFCVSVTVWWWVGEGVVPSVFFGLCGSAAGVTFNYLLSRKVVFVTDQDADLAADNAVTSLSDQIDTTEQDRSDDTVEPPSSAAA